jgi:hypothetical protein
MILSHGLMPEEPVALAFPRPADYYSTATPQAILPLWARYGCGALSLVILAVVFAVGVYLSSGSGLAQFIDFGLGMNMGELRGMYQPTVTEAQKQALEDEINKMREHLRAERVSVGSINPVLQKMTRAMGDEKLVPKEVDELIAATRAVNARARRAPTFRV